MTSIELIDKKEQLKLQAENLISGAEKESRKMNEEETNSYNTILDEINKVDEELRSIEMQLKKDELQKVNNNKQITKRNIMSKFSLIKAINSVANNQPLDERSSKVVADG